MDSLAIQRAVFIGASMGGLIAMVLAMIAPDRIAASVLNDVGPRLSKAGLSRIASYVGRSRPVSSWTAAAEAMRSTYGRAYPDRQDDEAFWLMLARRCFREREDGQLETDYDPHIALAFLDIEEDAPAPDLTPLFQALAEKPMLSFRGALSDILTDDALAHMHAMNPAMASVVIENVGHLPTLDEPEAWDAVLGFLARSP